MLGFWRTVKADHLSIKDQCLTALTCFVAILLTSLISHTLTHGQAPVLVASMGASAVILYVLPNSPLAQPWPLVMGHLLSAGIGVGIVYYAPSPTYAAATAVGLAALGMLLLRCVHPPGAATALAPILSASPPDSLFILVPVGINVTLMLLLATLLNQFILRRQYPAPITPPPAPANRNVEQSSEKNRLADFYQLDLETAIAGFESFVDVSYTDLSKLFTEVHLLAYQRQHASITCADIMLRNITTLDYGTDVESAWALMHAQHLKAMPVLDRARRVIGMVTAYDFLKHVKVTPFESFQQNLLDFIRKTPGLNTTKPEAIGHIMTRQVATLHLSASIADLLKLMLTQGHRYIPIIDEQQHFAGMVFQRDVLAALFHQKIKWLDQDC